MSSSIALPMLAAFAIGYLLGSVPFGLLLTRAAGLGDVRKIGSGSIGATNVLRTGNKGLAAATVLLDGLKGTLAVLIGSFVLVPWLVSGLSFGVPAGPNPIGQPVPDPTAGLVAGLLAIFSVSWMAGLGAVVGHVYPVWLGFKGGKGVATYVGVLIGAHWPAALVFAVLWLGTAAVTRISSLSAFVALAGVLVYLALNPQPVVLMAVALMTALIVWKHQANIQRLLAGTESRIGVKAAAPTGGDSA